MPLSKHICLIYWIYRESAPIVSINEESIDMMPVNKDQKEGAADNTIIYGRSCLAGDIFGEYALPSNLKITYHCVWQCCRLYHGQENWFNGVGMPAIVICRLDGSIDVQREFDYQDYKASLS